MDNKKPIVAIVCGGYSGEYSVSLRSGAGISSWIDSNLFEPFLYVIEAREWYVLIGQERIPIDRASFGFEWQGRVHIPSYAYITIHGTPGEDGHLQGYLDMLGIPYNTGGVFAEALTFNKYHCNRYLSSYPGVRVARSIRLGRTEATPNSREVIDSLGLPIFVKPNMGGSSVATSRVDTEEELEPAIALAREECHEVMLEQFIAGTEVTCGAYALAGEVMALPVTEVVTKNKFFDFDAKYKGEVEEITPARISDALTEEIQALTRRIYGYTDARGIIRVDYIIEADGHPTLLEVNTTPGMTPTSFIPQQVAAAGLKMPELLTALITEGLDAL